MEAVEPAGGTPPRQPEMAGGGDDVLADLRADLEQIDEVAVPDRVALFDRVNATIARELADLDEV